jgi:hypothetical protein
MRLPRHPVRWILAIVIGLPLAAWILLVLFTRPRADRDWANDQTRAATVTVSGTGLTVRDLRDFQYVDTTSVVEQYKNASFDLDEIADVWFVTSPFKTMPSVAHSFFSVRFTDGRTIAVSIEARRERGEQYSTWKGLLRRYELLYVWGTERDLLRLRAVARQDSVEMYKTTLSPEQGKALVVDLAMQSEKARTKPTFYNTLTQNCTTESFAALRTAIGRAPLSWDRRMIFSSSTPEMLQELALIAEPIDHAKADVTERIRKTSNDDLFSERLRQGS